MTISTQKEAHIINKICEPNFPEKRFQKLAEMIIRRQSDRQEAKRLNIPLKQYKQAKR